MEVQRGRMESGSPLMGLAAGKRAGSWWHRFLHVLTRLLGKSECKGEELKVKGLLEKPGKKQDGSRLESFPTY